MVLFQKEKKIMTLLASLTKFQGPLLIFKNLQDLSVVYFKERTARTFKTHNADFFWFFSRTSKVLLVTFIFIKNFLFEDLLVFIKNCFKDFRFFLKDFQGFYS